MFPNDGRNAIQFRLPESVVVCHANGCEPELREFSVSLDVNVRRLVSVAREEEKPIRATLQDSRTHRKRFCQLFGLLANSAPQIRLTSIEVDGSRPFAMIHRTDVPAVLSSSYCPRSSYTSTRREPRAPKRRCVSLRERR